MGCDLLLARLYKNHPDHAIAALRGIEPNVVDLEPPEPVQFVPSDEIKRERATAPLMPTATRIRSKVAAFYNLSVIEIFSNRRELHIVLPRQIAMYLTRKLALLSMPQIGRAFGDRDHTTVLHAERKIARKIEEDSGAKEVIEFLESELRKTVGA